MIRNSSVYKHILGSEPPSIHIIDSIIAHILPHEDISDVHPIIIVFSIGIVALNAYPITGIRLWFRDFPAAKLTFDFKSGIFNLDEVHPVGAIVGPYELDGFG